MKEEILNNIDDPYKLESLYRFNKSTFKREFNKLRSELANNQIADYWNARLNFDNPGISWGSNKDLLNVVLLALLAGLIIKIPDLFSISEEFFFPRNLAFVFGPSLFVYFAWKNELNLKTILAIIGLGLLSLFFINALPQNNESHTLILACIHLPIVLWAVLGFTFIGAKMKNDAGKLDYLRFNGDLIVISTIIAIAGFILMGLTILLFSMIGLDIGDTYAQYVGLSGAAAIPIVGTYVVKSNPSLVDKVSPVIAKIFSPLVLITLIAYLIAIVAFGKDPFNDRDFLLAFNALLIGVMAIILFSVAETNRSDYSRLNIIILFALSVTTILVNLIALSAIVFRISEWGISPNRLAVLGANVLILVNLVIVAVKLFGCMRPNSDIKSVELAITKYLPLYIIWAAIITFAFPFLFKFI